MGSQTMTPTKISKKELSERQQKIAQQVTSHMVRGNQEHQNLLQNLGRAIIGEPNALAVGCLVILVKTISVRLPSSKL